MSVSATAPSGTSTAVPESYVNAYIHPDNQKFQNIREQYYSVIDDLQKKADESGESGVAMIELHKTLLEANDIFENVKRVSEARLDSILLKKVSALGRSSIVKTQSGLLSFRPVEYIDRAVSYVNSLTNAVNEGANDVKLFDLNGNSLLKLEKEFSCFYNVTYGLEPFYGALEWKPAERKERCVREKSKPGISKTVEKVSDSISEEKQIDEVTRIYNILKRKFREQNHEPIIFYEFIIDPSSFSATVENMFHLSFLVRDGYVEVRPDPSFKIPCLIPLTKSQGEEGNPDEQNSQAIVNMSMATWKEAIELLDLEGKEPMIPRKKEFSKKRSL